MRVCRSLHALNPAYLSAAKGQFALLNRDLSHVYNLSKSQQHQRRYEFIFSVFYILRFDMLRNIYLAALSTLALTASSSAEGFYTKNSPVLQVDGSSYNKLVAKSNQVSVSSNVNVYQAES